MSSPTSASCMLICADDALGTDLQGAFSRDDRFRAERGPADFTASLERLVTAHPPDVVVLDQRLPGIDGGSAMRQVADAAPGAAIVVHSGGRGATATGASVGRSFVAAAAEGLAPESTHLFRLPATPTPALARQFSTEMCERWGAGSIVDSVQLVASELVTNARTHAAEPIGFQLGFTSERVIVVVRDSEPSAPSPRHPAKDAVAGRGLAIVGAFAIAWGYRPQLRGKAVWAVLGRGGSTELDDDTTIDVGAASRS